jgi:hypothetical protein
MQGLSGEDMQQIEISRGEITSHSPDVMLPPDPEFAPEYWRRVEAGRSLASDMTVTLVAICRNAMPWLPSTLELVEATGAMFGGFSGLIVENDSTDGTAEYLSQYSRDSDWLTVESSVNGRPHLNYTKEQSRTIALAEYRNRCREWVSSQPRTDLVIVYDTDPWGGWSIDGIATTVSYLSEEAYRDAAGMASYSWCEWGPPNWYAIEPCHYDAWACRWTWWTERLDMRWFHMWHPPVGSEPIRMRSAFGQLAVYRRDNYLRGVYDGSDCEHVGHWKTCGGGCYLNPSQRVVSFWIPDAAKKTTA